MAKVKKVKAPKEEAAPAAAPEPKEPISFLEALRKKYAKKDSSKNCSELGPSNGLSAIDAKKQMTLELLERVLLANMRVGSAGEEGELRTACPLIEELDLTGNPLASWETVLAISGQLERLRFLSLVRVALPEPTASSPLAALVTGSFRVLDTLVLNGTGISFDGATALCTHLPRLLELQLGDHDVRFDKRADGAEADAYAASLAAAFPNLRSLLLESAQLKRWTDAWALRQLPRLETLSLNSNPIESVHYDPDADGGRLPDADGGGRRAPFATLKQLFMHESSLPDWSHVDQIDRFPALKELRLQDAPCVHGIGASVARQLLIGRVGKIDTLNGASVNRREREAGERYYLRHLLDAYPAELPEPIHVAQADDPTAPPVPTLPAELGPVWAPFLAANPRWRDLVRAHGMHSAQLPRAADGGKTLAMQLVNLTLRSVAGESNDAAPTVRKLPTSLQVSKLKLICTQAFKLDPAKQRLFYQPPGETTKMEPGYLEELGDGTRPLTFYGVADGGTIVMDEWTDAQAEAQVDVGA